MNILIVTAHPSSKGLTHLIASTYAEAKRTKGNEVKIVNLFEKEYATECLTFESVRECQVSPVQKKFHEQLTWANEIVVVHPIWWGTPPSVMKRWVELAFWPHVAYRYTAPGKWIKMFEGKTAKVFATCGGPSWYYYFHFMPLKSFWATNVFGFCGIDLVDLKICNNLDILVNEKKAKHIEKFIEEIRKSA